jgi:hypothetical protein
MDTVKMNGTVDYSYPKIQAEQKIREAHNLILQGKYEQAAEETLHAITEIKLMRTAILSHLPA